MNEFMLCYNHFRAFICTKDVITFHNIFPFGSRIIVVNYLLCVMCVTKKLTPVTLELDIYKLGPLTLDLKTKTVLINGTPVALTKTEFRLLVYLVKNTNKIVSLDDIVISIWGESAKFNMDQANIRAQILNLRKKIEFDYHNPKLIVNVIGFGYRFVSQEIS